MAVGFTTRKLATFSLDKGILDRLKQVSKELGKSQSSILEESFTDWDRDYGSLLEEGKRKQLD